MDRTLHWKAVEQYFTVVLFVIQNLLILDLALSGVNGLKSPLIAKQLAHLNGSTLQFQVQRYVTHGTMKII